MISGTTLRLATALTLAALTPTICAAATSPEALVGSLARPAPAHTAFTEVRFLGMLERPLVLTGELAWLGGDHLRRSVATPYREQSDIADGTLRVQRGERPPREMPLTRAPELKGLLLSFQALLSGDAAVLAGAFDLRADGDDAHWTLHLVPRDAALRRRVRAITVDGGAQEPRCLSLEEADGDATVTLLGAAAEPLPSAHVTRAELAARCSGTAAR